MLLLLLLLLLLLSFSLAGRRRRVKSITFYVTRFFALIITEDRSLMARDKYPESPKVDHPDPDVGVLADIPE